MVALLYAMLLDTMCKTAIRRLIFFLPPSALEINQITVGLKFSGYLEAGANKQLGTLKDSMGH